MFYWAYFLTFSQSSYQLNYSRSQKKHKREEATLEAQVKRAKLIPNERKEKRQQVRNLPRHTREAVQNESGLCQRRHIKAPLDLHELWDPARILQSDCVTFALIPNMLTLQDLDRRTARRRKLTRKMTQVNKVLLTSHPLVRRSAPAWMDGILMRDFFLVPASPVKLCLGLVGMSHYLAFIVCELWKE